LADGSGTARTLVLRPVRLRSRVAGTVVRCRLRTPRSGAADRYGELPVTTND